MEKVAGIAKQFKLIDEAIESADKIIMEPEATEEEAVKDAYEQLGEAKGRLMALDDIYDIDESTYKYYMTKIVDAFDFLDGRSDIQEQMKEASNEQI